MKKKETQTTMHKDNGVVKWNQHVGGRSVGGGGGRWLSVYVALVGLSRSRPLCFSSSGSGMALKFLPFLLAAKLNSGIPYYCDPDSDELFGWQTFQCSSSTAVAKAEVRRPVAKLPGV